jgi:hypothetical protein
MYHRMTVNYHGKKFKTLAYGVKHLNTAVFYHKFNPRKSKYCSKLQQSIYNIGSS